MTRNPFVLAGSRFHTSLGGGYKLLARKDLRPKQCGPPPILIYLSLSISLSVCLSIICFIVFLNFEIVTWPMNFFLKSFSFPGSSLKHKYTPYSGSTMDSLVRNANGVFAPLPSLCGVCSYTNRRWEKR